MTKREAFAILVQKSGLFTPELQEQILSKLDQFTDEEITTMGQALAREKRLDIAERKRVLGRANELLVLLEQETDK